MKKYELTSETKNGLFGQTLYRIKSCINFTTVSGHEVKKGDLGGWVEKEENLSQNGKAWIFDDAEVCGNAKILDSAVVCGNAKVFGNAEICGNAEVSHNAEVFGNARVSGNAKICDSAEIYGNAEIYDSAEVCDSAEVFGNARVCGKAKIYDIAGILGYAQVYGNAEISGNARVTGNAVIYGNARVFENAEICGDAEVCGDAVISKDAYIFSLEHLLCVSPFPVNGHPANLTMFRTKKCEINIQFDKKPAKSIDEFKAFIDTFDDMSDRLALMAAIELGKRRIRRQIFKKN